MCLTEEAQLINVSCTEVRLKLRSESEHRSIRSPDLPGNLDAITPDQANLERYDLVGLAMQEPQYAAPEVKQLLVNIANANLPCLSIMNMPPLAYLKRIPSLSAINLEGCYRDASVWQHFDPANVTLCSPDPQAFRPPEEKLNILHVGLPTNFKAANLGNEKHQNILTTLSKDIDAVRLDDQDVPVKLRVFDSLFVPMAKWSMLLTGNYRCIAKDGVQSIRDSVHGEKNASAEVYSFVDTLVQKLGGSVSDAVPFEKYANAAENLLKPSSAARAIDAGATNIERVDKLVQTIGREFDLQHPVVDEIVETVNTRLSENGR